jgi:hypothetical protein
MSNIQNSASIGRQSVQDMAQTRDEILGQAQEISLMSQELNAALSRKKASGDLKSALLKSVSESIKDIKNLA